MWNVCNLHCHFVNDSSYTNLLLVSAKIRLLFANKVFVAVLSKYWNNADVFLFDFRIELSKNTSINEHAIELVVEGKQPFYKLFYKVNKIEDLKNLYWDLLEN